MIFEVYDFSLWIDFIEISLKNYQPTAWGWISPQTDKSLLIFAPIEIFPLTNASCVASIEGK